MLEKFLTRKNIDLTTTLVPVIAVVFDSVFSHFEARDLTVHDALMWGVMTIIGFLATKDRT